MAPSTTSNGPDHPPEAVCTAPSTEGPTAPAVYPSDWTVADILRAAAWECDDAAITVKMTVTFPPGAPPAQVHQSAEGDGASSSPSGRASPPRAIPRDTSGSGRR